MADIAEFSKIHASRAITVENYSIWCVSALTPTETVRAQMVPVILIWF
jgi:hypothetical protein